MHYPEINALAKYLDVDAQNINRATYDDLVLIIDGEEYLCLTDSEADERTENYIAESLWAFNASFILEQCDLPQELEPMFKQWQSEQCESANDALQSLINKCCNFKDFVRAAIDADGRGHFIASYDSKENTQELDSEIFYIYRVN